MPPTDRALTEALLETVREQMTERGVSIAALAEKLGMNRPTLSRQLRGNGVLTIDEWQAIAVALGAHELEDLLAEARRKM